METILLLTSEAEQQFLRPLLESFSPSLTVVPVATLDALLAVPPAVLKTARLIAFATEVIVPAAVLDRLGYGAYNFHPGPPEYPGSAVASFALYEQAKVFGATAHLMRAKVDSGPIIGVELAHVPAGITLPHLEELAYTAAARLFWRLAEPLMVSHDPLPDIGLKWGPRKTSRRTFAAMCEIPADITADDLARRLAAFGSGYGGAVPTVTLHGHRFALVTP